MNNSPSDPYRVKRELALRRAHASPTARYISTRGPRWLMPLRIFAHTHLLTNALGVAVLYGLSGVAGAISVLMLLIATLFTSAMKTTEAVTVTTTTVEPEETLPAPEQQPPPPLDEVRATEPTARPISVPPDSTLDVAVGLPRVVTVNASANTDVVAVLDRLLNTLNGKTEADSPSALALDLSLLDVKLIDVALLPSQEALQHRSYADVLGLEDRVQPAEESLTVGGSGEDPLQRIGGHHSK